MMVIVNPRSGRGRGEDYARDLLAALHAHGLSPTVLTTQRRGHAQELAAQALAAGARMVVACGGDGTVQEAAQVLAHGQAGLAVAPAGRCNDFARCLGHLPNPGELAQALADPSWRSLDLAQAGQRIFCTVGAVGFDALVSRYVDGLRLPLKGQPAYMLGVARVLMGFKPWRVRLTWDRGVYEGPLFLAAVGNTPTYGNQIPIVPPARPDDGLLDLCLVRPAGFWRVLSLLPTLLDGGHARLPEVSFLRTRGMLIESLTPLEMWADGEPLGMAPLEIKVLPGALKVLDVTRGGLAPARS